MFRRFFALVVLVSSLVGCSGGGGGGGADSSELSWKEQTPAIYTAENYTDTELDDTDLSGVWMLVEKASAEFDLDYVSSLEQTYTFEYLRRATLAIVPSPYSGLGTHIILHGMDNDGVSIQSMFADGGTVTFWLEGYEFTGSIINNLLIEGGLSGSDGEGVTILSSKISLVKIQDLESISEADLVSEATISLNGVSDFSIGGVTIALDNPKPLMFEQTIFDGKDYVDGELVSISGETLYAALAVEAGSLDQTVGISLLKLNSSKGNSNIVDVMYYPSQPLIFGTSAVDTKPVSYDAVQLFYSESASNSISLSSDFASPFVVSASAQNASDTMELSLRLAPAG